MNTPQSPKLLVRRPEPELMDDAAQARAYADADFEQANSLFIDTFTETFPDFTRGRVIDLGCGPADIPVRFVRRYPDSQVLGVDGSPAMIALAQARIDGEKLGDRLSAMVSRLGEPGLRSSQSAGFDAILSNSLLHHLHDPMLMWRTISELAKPSAAVLIMDLIRPQTQAAAQAIVEQYSGNEPEILRRDFYHSLLAAFREDEVREQLHVNGLSQLRVRRISDRHLAVSGHINNS